MITDQEYPALVAHQVLSKTVDEFLSKHPPATWINSTAKNSIQFPQLRGTYSLQRCRKTLTLERSTLSSVCTFAQSLSHCCRDAR
jgi:hypothetical protein